MKSCGARIVLAIMVLSLLAFALRVWDLGGRPMALDEIAVLQRVLAPQSGLHRAHAETRWAAPPLYPLFLFGLRSVLGTADVSLRFGSVVWSLLALTLLYALGTRWWGRRVGALSMLLGTLLPLGLLYARRASPYPMAAALSLLAVYALERGLAERSKPWSVTAVLSAAAAIGTSYLALALLPIMTGQALLAWSARRQRLAVAALSVLLLLALAALAIAYTSGRWMRGGWYGALVLLDEWRAALRTLTLGEGFPSQRTLLLELLALALFVAGACGPARQASRGRLWLLAAPLALGAPALSLLRPGQQASEPLALLVSPPLCLGAAAGWHMLKRRVRPLATASGFALLIGMAFAIPVQIFGTGMAAGPDYRAAAKAVADNERADDCIVLGSDTVQTAFQHYYRGSLPAVSLDRTEPALVLEPLSARCGRLWLVAETDAASAWLDDRGWLIDRASYPNRESGVSVKLYLTKTPELVDDPVSQHPMRLSFGNQALEGYDLPLQPVAGGERAWVTLYWRTLVAGRRVGVSLRLLDAQGRLWARNDGVPYPARSPDSWPEGSVVRYDASLLVPPGVPPGWYRLELRLYDPQSGRPIDPLPDKAPPGPIALGPLRVESTRLEPGTLRRLPAGTRILSGGGIQCGDSLALRAYRLRETTIGPGSWLQIDLYWQVLDPPGQGLVQTLQLVDAQGRVLAERIGSPVVGEHAFQSWRANELLWSQQELLVPSSLPSGTYSLRLSMRTESGQLLPTRDQWHFWAWGQEHAGLGSIVIEELPEAFVRPPMQMRVDAHNTAGIDLLGVDGIPERVSAGQRLDLALHWRAVGAIQNSYKVSLQLLASDRRTILAQDDGIPGGWARPTTSWQPGDLILDQRHLQVPAGSGGQQGLLIVALYDEDTGKRSQWLTGKSFREYWALRTIDIVH
ncbi:MAG: ArnT family glycosyltransferase [Anaerolineae bacterium]